MKEEINQCVGFEDEETRTTFIIVYSPQNLFTLLLSSQRFMLQIVVLRIERVWSPGLTKGC